MSNKKKNMLICFVYPFPSTVRETFYKLKFKKNDNAEYSPLLQQPWLKLFNETRVFCSEQQT